MAAASLLASATEEELGDLLLLYRSGVFNKQLATLKAQQKSVPWSQLLRSALSLAVANLWRAL